VNVSGCLRWNELMLSLDFRQQAQQIEPSPSSRRIGE
jgi:hypothetical protein